MAWRETEPPRYRPWPDHHHYLGHRAELAILQGLSLALRKGVKKRIASLLYRPSSCYRRCQSNSTANGMKRRSSMQKVSPRISAGFFVACALIPSTLSEGPASGAQWLGA